jgi:hypothetical protein
MLLARVSQCIIYISKYPVVYDKYMILLAHLKKTWKDTKMEK